MTTYYKNKARCKICGDIIESISVHDYEECKCGACAVDGGLEYFRRSWDPKYGNHEDVMEELIEEITPEEYEKYRI